jgi:hypothetical protein
MELLESEQRAAHGRLVNEERFLADQIERDLSPLMTVLGDISIFLQTNWAYPRVQWHSPQTQTSDLLTPTSIPK